MQKIPESKLKNNTIVSLGFVWKILSCIFCQKKVTNNNTVENSEKN